MAAAGRDQSAGHGGSKPLLGFLAIVGLQTAIGAVSLADLGRLSRRGEDFVRLQRKLAAYRRIRNSTTSRRYRMATAMPAPDPAARAVRMVPGMRAGTAGLSAGRRQPGHHLQMGVGIAQGFAGIGSIGVEGRIDHGATGTVTKLAARREAPVRNAWGRLRARPRT